MFVVADFNLASISTATFTSLILPSGINSAKLIFPYEDTSLTAFIHAS